MVKFGGISGEQLRQYITRIEKLNDDKQDIADNIKDVYAEARGKGFDPKIMRELIKLRKMDANDRNEQESILDIYKHAMGMTPMELHIRNSEEAEKVKEIAKAHGISNEIADEVNKKAANA